MSFFKQKCNEETSLLNDNMDKIRNPHFSENTHPQAKKDNSHIWLIFFLKNKHWQNYGLQTNSIRKISREVLKILTGIYQFA